MLIGSDNVYSKNSNSPQDLISISVMTHNDIEQVLKIEEQCNLSKWSKKDYKKELVSENSIALVAKQNQNIVGFLLARTTSAESDLYNIGVLENHQKKGVGGLLLKKFLLIGQKRNVRSFWLEVRESNLNAIKFYRKYGFREIQKRNNFYSKPSEHAIVMKYETPKIDKISE
jgi:ribosomal-protein-alanine N-acetyltransferase